MGEGKHSVLVELQTAGPSLETSVENYQKAKNKSTIFLVTWPKNLTFYSIDIC